MYSSLFGRRKVASFANLAGCQMPPPCNLGYSQFKMPGTNTMCCRRSTIGVKKQKPCKSGKVRCAVTGRCVTRKNVKKCGTPKAPGKFDNAVRILKENYSFDIKGKSKSPSFITNRKKVSGKNTAEKIANIRRVLSTCKRAGVKLVKVDRNGNPTGFKAFSTLVRQCNVTFSKESKAGTIFSELKKPRYTVNNAVASWRSRSPSISSSEGVFERALRTPLPDDLGMEMKEKMDFGRMRSRFGRIRFG